MQISNNDNLLYGLHALNNLDIAVNGRDVNTMPSYKEVRRQTLDSSGGSAEYSPPSKRNNLITPPKPPRKAPSMSPPSMRRNTAHHYDRPTSVVEQLHMDPRFKKRMMDSSGECDSYFMSTTEETSSEQPSSTNNYAYNRNNGYDSPSRLNSASPTRTCMTDSEILRSPSEVLYAVSDQHRYHDNNTVHHSSSQTLDSELRRRRLSKDVLREDYNDNRRNCYADENKENSFKTRISVVSPTTDLPQYRMINRKPYKTTINTANDNIQYRQDKKYYMNPEHYKVPRNDRNNQFTSTRLVKNIETRRSELDREGRSIRRSNGRTYSGCSTSPDREISPDRYAKPRVPVRSYSNNNRSPSSSPTRPPRSKSSPGRDIRRNISNKFGSSSRVHGRGDPQWIHSDGRRTAPRLSDEEDRLSRFTEYRGGDSSVMATHSPRASNGDISKSEFGTQSRERGQSLPPGAAIDSIRDFYKSSQFKSMYALPPSPNRPAPVLDRSGSHSTLFRSKDKGKVHRIINSESEFHQRRHPVSPKRQAPSPPRLNTVERNKNNNNNNFHRVISSDREDYNNGRRGVSIERSMQHPSPRRPTQRRRQSVEGIMDSSYSESEGVPVVVAEDKTVGELGRRWSGTHHSDLDSDYRRDLATSNSSLHKDARSRDTGGIKVVSSSTLGRHGHSKHTKKKEANTKSLDRSYDNRYQYTSATDDDVRSPTREEERRKVLEMERLHHRNGNTIVSNRSGHRGGGRVIGLTNKKPRNSESGGDHDSNYSGSSLGNQKVTRYDQNRVGRIKRSTSSAANSAVGVRREINRRKPHGGSATSSLNSSESETNRSVFQHSTAVADIPTPTTTSGGQPSPPRRTSSENRENLSPMSLQKSQKISRSISLLAPWKPRNYKDKFEIHYDNGAVRRGSKSKPPRPPSAAPRRISTMQRGDKKSASSTDLLQNEDRGANVQPSGDHQRIRTLQRKPAPKVSRSVSIPKDTRLAGWFKKRKKA